MFDAICNDFGVLIPPYTFACLDQIVYFFRCSCCCVVDGGVDGVVGTVVVSTVVVDTVVVDTVVVGGGGACCRLKTWARH